MYVILIHRVGSEGPTVGVAFVTESPTLLREAFSEIFKECSEIRRENCLGVGVSVHEIFDKLFLDIDKNSPPLSQSRSLIYEMRRRHQGWTESWRDEEGKLISERNNDPEKPQRLPQDHA